MNMFHAQVRNLCGESDVGDLSLWPFVDVDDIFWMLVTDADIKR